VRAFPVCPIEHDFFVERTKTHFEDQIKFHSPFTEEVLKKSELSDHIREQLLMVSMAVVSASVKSAFSSVFFDHVTKILSRV